MGLDTALAEEEPKRNPAEIVYGSLLEVCKQSLPFETGPTRAVMAVYVRFYHPEFEEHLKNSEKYLTCPLPTDVETLNQLAEETWRSEGLTNITNEIQQKYRSNLQSLRIHHYFFPITEKEKVLHAFDPSPP